MIGVGKLGSAILGFDELKKYGLDILAGFDTNIENKIFNKPVFEFTEENIKEFIMNSQLIVSKVLVISILKKAKGNFLLCAN